jgi:hypothetical protein
MLQIGYRHHSAALIGCSRLTPLLGPSDRDNEIDNGYWSPVGQLTQPSVQSLELSTRCSGEVLHECLTVQDLTIRVKAFPMRSGTGTGQIGLDQASLSCRGPEI